MRLQLDPATTGSQIARSNETAAASGSGFDSRRVGGDGANGDTIRISGPSSALGAMSSERAARIQQLTTQVQAGTYNVPGSRISQAMVAHAASWAGSGAE